MKTPMTVADSMTEHPYTVGAEQTLGFARELMTMRHVRHLPVLKGGNLVGLLSERDISLASSAVGAAATSLSVEELMSPGVFAVTQATPLAEVADTMATKKYGSAVVMEGRQVVGILTAVDLCRVLAEVLSAE